MSDPTIVQLSKDVPNIDAYLAGITHVHASCIEHDKTLATFLPPLSYAKMLQWWHGQFESVIANRLHIWISLAPISSRKNQLESPLQDNKVKPIHLDQQSGEGYEVAGLVCLSMPWSETGPHRGEILKLLVSPNHRQKGLARQLMTVLERGALKEGKWYLMLDTEVGSPAEKVYPRLGYTMMGVVPEFGYSPVPGKMSDEMWFYKNLRRGSLADSGK